MSGDVHARSRLWRPLTPTSLSKHHTFTQQSKTLDRDALDGSYNPPICTQKCLSLQVSNMASLESLPVEIQHDIFSYLIRPLSSYPHNGMARTFFLHTSLLCQTKNKDIVKNHPYLNLAASSRQLRDTIEAYCRSLLVQHHGTIYKKVMGDRKLSKAYRTIWLNKTYKHCLFCGKTTVRRAVFNMLMWCCLKCDNTHYGKRIVSTLTLLDSTVGSCLLVQIRRSNIAQGQGNPLPYPTPRLSQCQPQTH
jgi:ribosomal protein L37AE/L43A